VGCFFFNVQATFLIHRFIQPPNRNRTTNLTYTLFKTSTSSFMPESPTSSSHPSTSCVTSSVADTQHTHWFFGASSSHLPFLLRAEDQAGLIISDINRGGRVGWDARGIEMQKIPISGREDCLRDSPQGHTTLNPPDCAILCRPTKLDRRT
jgi:hypothetical protein